MGDWWVLNIIRKIKAWPDVYHQLSKRHQICQDLGPHIFLEFTPVCLSATAPTLDPFIFSFPLANIYWFLTAKDGSYNVQQNRFSLCFLELSDKPTGWRSLVMGDIMGKGRVLRGRAERGSDKNEISHCMENSPVDKKKKKKKACPAGSVLSHWEKDKGGQGRGQAALEGGEGLLLLC